MIVSISADLISSVAGVPVRDLSQLRALDLHLKDHFSTVSSDDDTESQEQHQLPQHAKIRRIENLHIVPNLRQLNLSYNAITRIEGLGHLAHLIELNLAENAIRKIEGLEGLKSLERLNLSGNQIERIPEHIRQLSRLTHFRIARNQLHQINDIQHLASLERLTNLRIDENPISELEHITVYTVFHVPSLIYLDGVEISDKIRDQGRKKYATDQLSSIKTKINMEQHRLQRLRRELQSGPEASLVMQVGNSSMTALSRSQQIQLDDANKVIALKLDEVKRVESDLAKLNDTLQRMMNSAGNTATPSMRSSYDVTFSSPESEEYDSESFQLSRSFTNPTTPTVPRTTARTTNENPNSNTNVNPSSNTTNPTTMRASFNTSSPSNLSTPAADVAGKKIVDLNERVEKLAAKVLTSEKEKQALKVQLDQQKLSQDIIKRLQLELEECEQQLEQALHAAKSSNDEANELQQEVETYKATLKEANEQMIRKDYEMEALRSEVSSLRQENLELRKANREQRQYQDVMRKATSANTLSALDDMRIQDLRLQAMNQKLSLEEMQSLNERLSRELDHFMSQSNQSNALLVSCREENDSLKRKLQQIEQKSHEKDSTVTSLESDLRRLQASNDDLRQQQVSWLKEKDQLMMKMSVLDNDLQSLLYAKRKSPQKQNGNTSSNRVERGGYSSKDTFVSEQNRRIRPSTNYQQSNYFEVESVDSEDHYHPPVNAKANQNKRYVDNTHGNTTPGGSSKIAVVSALERSAAEIIASVIIEEMQQSKLFSSSTSNSLAMKEACVRAALRLVHTSSMLASGTDVANSTNELLEDGDEEEKSNLRTPTRPNRPSNSLYNGNNIMVAPFQALGSRQVLSKLISDTHAGLALLEDAALMKEEIQQLQKLQDELEEKVASTERSLLAKELDRKNLEKHANDARKQAEMTLSELEQLTKKLQSGRDELIRLDAEQNLIHREVEVARYHLQECLALTEIEHKNIAQLRDRYSQLKQDHHDMERQLSQVKDSQLMEENKRLSAKSGFQEEIRLLQSEKSTLSQECKSMQHLLEELRKRYQMTQEELSLQQRDYEHQALLQRKLVEEESHKLQVLTNEMRLLKFDVDTLVQRKATLEQEVNSVTDRARDEKSRQMKETEECKQRISLLQKQHHELQDNLALQKEALQGVESKIVTETRRLEDIKQAYLSLQQNYERKSRCQQDDLQQQQSTYVHWTGQIREKQGQVSDLQHQLDILNVEVRSQERKREEMKKSIEEYETQCKLYQGSLGQLDVEKKKIAEELTAVTKSRDEIKASLQQYQQQHLQYKQQHDDLLKQIQYSQQSYNGVSQQLDTVKSQVMAEKRAYEDLQAQVISMKVSLEKEKRTLEDLQQDKSLLLTEKQSVESSIQSLRQRQQEEQLKQHELDLHMTHALQEYHSLQRQVTNSTEQLTLLQQQREDAKKDIEHQQRSYHKMQLSLEHINTSVTQQQHALQQLQQSYAQLQLQVQNREGEIAKLDKVEKDKSRLLDKLTLEIEQLEIYRANVEKMITKQEEEYNVEVKRLNKVEQTYGEVEKALQGLRSELITAEKQYHSMRHLTVEESQKVEQQRRIFQLTVDELNRLEGAIKQSQLTLEEEKRRAMDDLGKLEAAKRSAQAHMCLVHETQKRLQQQPVAANASNIGGRRYASPPQQVLTSTSRPNISNLTTNATRPSNIARPLSNHPRHSDSQLPVSHYHSGHHSDDENSISSSSTNGPPVLSSLQQAVEQLRMQSSAALHSVHN